MHTQEKVTLKQRVWHSVKNEPGITSVRIAKILGESSICSVSPALATMEKQGYVYSYGRGTRNDPKRYYTDLGTYVPIKDRVDLVEDHNCKKVLPLVTKGLALPPRPTFHKPNVQPMLSFGLGAAEPANKIDAFVSGLPMGEAKALYDRLHSYFGPKQEGA